MNASIDLATLSPEEFKLWQKRLLETLVYFRDFCQKHNLRFVLSGGTCIGAVRHHGFIPWDDDVDVAMPRKDYDLLAELWPKYADNNRFSCMIHTKDQCTKFPMIVIKNENTTCIYNHSKDLDISQGMKIDVEFLDGTPTNKIHRIFNYICANLLAIYRAQRIPNQKSQLKRICTAILLGIVPTNKLRFHISNFLENRLRDCKYEDAEKVQYLQNMPIPRKYFDEIIWVDFEGEKMPIPAGYDEFLRLWYNDYMQLPPENDRIPKTHNILFYDLNNSYKKYRGKEYLKK